MKLGRLPPAPRDPRTVRLAKYLGSQLPIPPACDWTSFCQQPFDDYQNNDIGICGFAARAHVIHSMSAAAGRERVPLESTVVAGYSEVTGYDPQRPETDRGVVMLDVLKWWRKGGNDNSPLGAYAAVSRSRQRDIMAAISLFGAAYVGLRLPLAAQERLWEFTPGNDPAEAPNSWGGHAVGVFGFNDTGLLYVSYGEARWMSWGFFHAYSDEAWAMISPEFLSLDGQHAPNGLDIKTLRDDLRRITA